MAFLPCDTAVLRLLHAHISHENTAGVEMGQKGVFTVNFNGFVE